MEPAAPRPIVDDFDLLRASLGELPASWPRAVLMAVSGLPGTGKSHLAQALREKLPLVVLESDALRKTLFPHPDYRSGESAHLFCVINRLTGHLLGQGISVLLDATNLTENVRRRYYRLAERWGVPFYLILVEAPPDLVRQRLRERQGRPECRSDADWAVYQRMKAGSEPVRQGHLVVDTSEDIRPFIARLVREIDKGRRQNGN
jgi:predicted kinase